MDHARAKLLLVDDYAPALKALARVLGDDGFECACAAGGTEALALLGASSFDLVLLDVEMDGMTGLDVLRAIRRTTPLHELPVIMVTGRDSSFEVAGGLREGANDYVTKPLDLDVLLARINSQLSLLALSRLKDEFLRVVTHDLKNPLSAILMGVECLVDDFPVGTVMTEEGAGMTMTVFRAAQSMRELIHDFLEMQFLEDGRLTLDQRDVDLVELATSVLQVQRAYAASKHITLEIAPPPSEAPPRAHADRARLEQVLRNLVGNAIKFSGPQTRVTVRLCAGAGESGGVRVEVRDEGPGIAPADQAKLFVKHARLANRPTGGEHSSGLGLAICKRLVELQGGRIGARNNPEGRGATFWFELP